MKTQIHQYIIENKSVHFEQLFKTFQKEQADLTKPMLGQLLKELESEGKCAEIDKQWLDLSVLPEITGHVHWNINQLCWLDQQDSTNDFAICFNGEDNLLTVYNKRKAFYGSFVKARVLKLGDEPQRQVAYITETVACKDVKLVAVYMQETKDWTVLNSNGGFSFKHAGSNPCHDGDIALFSYEASSRVHRMEQSLGNIADKGIESRLVQMLAQLKPNEENTATLTSPGLMTLNKPFFTIDSIHTKDIDDAIWIEKSPGGYQLWVAIADVSSVVKKNDSQDLHAQQQATTFYFGNSTVHMLCRHLAEAHCSLNVGENRGALICHLEFDHAGKLLEKEFIHHNIVSHARLTYEDVDKIIENRAPVQSLVVENGEVKAMNSAPAWLAQSLATLRELSILHHKPYKPDYWFVPSPDYELNEQGKIQKLYLDNREGSPAQQMVETAMLATNMAAAQYIYENKGSLGLFRNQAAPQQSQQRPKAAFYDSNNEGHWGLQAQFYTHFTSPIRRYCDLIAHRVIKDIVYAQPSSYSNEEIQAIGMRINHQQYVAKQCSIKEKNLLMNQYIHGLVKDGQLQSTYKLIDYNEGGIVVRNSQLIEMFIPAFKLERNFADTIKALNQQALSPDEKLLSLEEVNNQWKIKCFVDKYNWVSGKKEIFYKLYPREASSNKPEKEKKSHVAL